MEQMNKHKVIAVAEDANGFSFSFLIEKATLADEALEDNLCITGIASTPNIDHDLERMAEPALVRMANIINEKSVPLRVEHQKHDNAIIGKVNEAWMDERNKLWIKAVLDKENPAAVMLHNALKSGAKLGLSVGGRVKRASRELSEGQGKMIKTFYDVILDEVSVTPRPSNYDSWLVQKSYISEGEDTNKYANSKLHDTFLYENPKFDYIAAIEKSIPTQAWKKVEPELLTKETSNMKKEENKKDDVETTKVEEPTQEETTKYASVNYVDKKFAELTKSIETMFTKFTQTEATGTEREVNAPAAETQEADAQHLPTQPKKENPAQERTVKAGANGAGADDNREATGEGGIGEAEQTAHNQDNPDEVKETPDAQVREKNVTKTFLDKFVNSLKKAAETAASDETPAKPEKKEKAVEDMKDDKKETEKAADASDSTSHKEKAATDDAESSGSAKDAKKATDEKEGDTEKTEVKDEDYDLPEIKRSAKDAASIDVFASYIAKSIDDLEARLAKNGKRVPGLRRMVVDSILGDEAIQKSMQSMMRESGVKRSVSFGTPYVTTKDGQRFRLMSANEVEVKKNINTKAKFSDVYKTHFSSSNDQNQVK